jgi:plastocyanin
MKFNKLAFTVLLVMIPFTLITTNPTFASEAKKAPVIRFEAKEVNGAKVWTPANATAKVGQLVTLEVTNTLSAPHGFKIDGYVADQTILPGKTQTFTITPKEKGTLKVYCQLHPAHVAANIKVE